MSPSPSPLRHKLLPLAGIGVVWLIQGWVSLPTEKAALSPAIDLSGYPYGQTALSAPGSDMPRPRNERSPITTDVEPTPLAPSSATEVLPLFELPAQPNAFLNRDLQIVGEVFPEMYEEYLSAPPRKRARLAHALLTYSMTIILCADGDGPLPEGHPMEGVLTGDGLDDVGRSAFHINDWTLQYHLDRFPEVQQYRRNRAAQRRFGLVGMRPLPLSSALEQAILDRAAEAFSYLD